MPCFPFSLPYSLPIAIASCLTLFLSSISPYLSLTGKNIYCYAYTYMICYFFHWLSRCLFAYPSLDSLSITLCHSLAHSLYSLQTSSLSNVARYIRADMYKYVQLYVYDIYVYIIYIYTCINICIYTHIYICMYEYLYIYEY